MEEKRSSAPLIIGISVAILVLAGIAIYALSTQQDEAPATEQTDTTQTTTPTTDTDTDATSEQTMNETITFTDAGFNPGTLTVKKGTVVTVKNDSDTDVQFSSDDHPTHMMHTELNLAVLSPGDSDTFTVTKVGTWGFHDHIDESKTGTLIVTE